MANFTSLFSWGDHCYLSTDPEQAERIIVKVIFCPDGIMYAMMSGTKYSEHYEIELSTEKNPLIRFQS